MQAGVCEQVRLHAQERRGRLTLRYGLHVRGPPGSRVEMRGVGLRTRAVGLHASGGVAVRKPNRKFA